MTPVDVTVNGDRLELPEPHTVALLVELLELPPGGRGVAVAVDGEVVPRSAWPSRELRGNEKIEVLVATQGG
jgi:sulfur carrier protein